MPYAASGGAYTNVAGATTAVAGNIIQSATWDNIHIDYGTALTQVMQQLISMVTDRNALYMNGGMEVWQRGAGNSASISVAATTLAYTADRWYIQTGANQAHVVSAQVGLEPSGKSALCAQVQRTAAQTGTTGMVFAYPLDSDEILRLRGSKVSFSCLVKAGANWSPTNGTLTVTLFTGTGASPAKRNATPYAGELSPISQASNLTAGGSVTTITANSSTTIGTNVTQAELQFSWTPVGTAGAADTIQIDDVQLEAQLSASTWTPTNFDRTPFDRQLQACQRHYCKTFPYNVAPVQAVGNVQGCPGVGIQALSLARIYWSFPVRLRTNPTSTNMTTYNPGAANNQVWNASEFSSLGLGFDPVTELNDNGVMVSSTVTATAINDICVIHITASAGI